MHPSLARAIAITVALAAAITVAPAAHAAEPEGPQVNGVDALEGASAGDLVAHRWSARSWPDGGARLSVRQRSTGGWSTTYTYVDGDRDGEPDLVVQLAASGDGPIFVQYGRPGNTTQGCRFRGFPPGGVLGSMSGITQSVSGLDRRTEVVLPAAALASTLGETAAFAPRVVTVAYGSSGPVIDTLPDAGAGSTSCVAESLLGLDLAKGSDRGQSGVARTQRLFDAPDGNGTDGDILDATVEQYAGTQPSGDPTALGSSPATVTVHPTDLRVRFEDTTAQASAILHLYSSWFDTDSTRGAPIGSIVVRSDTSTGVLVDVYRKRGGAALPGGDTTCTPAPETDEVLLRSGVRLHASGGEVRIPLDLALGVFDGVITDTADFRYALVGRGSTPDHVPDTIGYTNAGSALGACAAGGLQVNPAQLPLVRSSAVNPMAALTASPEPVPRGTTLTLDASGSTTGTFGSGARYRFEADGGRVFTPASAASTAPFADRRFTRTTRVLVRDNVGTIDMAQAISTVENVPPVALITPATSRIVLPYAAPSTGSASFDATGSSDPDGSASALTYAWELRENDAAGTVVKSASGQQFSTPVFARAQGIRVYRLRLRVTDPDGASTDAARTLTLVDGPEARVLSISPLPLYPGQTATITAKSSGIGSSSPFQFSFDPGLGGGYGPFGSATTTTASYPAPGPRTARVRVRDADGNLAESGPAEDLDFAVTPPGQVPPQARLAATVAGATAPPARPRSGEDPVRFDASGSTLRGPNATPDLYRFDFGDGSAVRESTGPVVEHTYAGSGPVTATVVVRDQRSGQINDSPPAGIDLDVAPGSSDAYAPRGSIVRVAPSSGSVFAGQPVTLRLDALVVRSGAPSVAWDLDGDGTFETQREANLDVTTTYAQPGTRAVRARITDTAARSGVTPPLEVAVRATPTQPPIVVLKAPTEVRLTGSDVAVELDATGSKGQEEDPALTYAFDLDGDGTYETATGSTPKATARLRERGPVQLGVRATDSYGLSAEKRVEVIVRTTADDLAGCAGKAVLRTVNLGPIGARGCFTRIDRGSAGPLFIAFGDVDLNGLRITGADGSTVVPRTFPDCDGADCQEAQRAFNQPGGSASIALDLSAAKLWSARPVALKLEGSEVNLPLSLGPIDVDLPFGKSSDGFLVRLPKGAALLGLPVEGDAEVRFPSAGRTKVKVNVGFPLLIGGGATAAVDVEARTGEGARLDELVLKLDTSLLGKVLKLKKLEVRYVRVDKLFRGGVQLSLPFKREFDIGAAIQIKDGALDSLFGEVEGLNRHIGKGVFLQGVRAGVQTDPFRVLGGVQLSAGPRVKRPGAKAGDLGFAVLLADGDFVLQLPTNGRPAIFGLTAKGTIAGVLPLADASVLVSQNGFVAVHAQIGGDYKVGFLRAGIDGWVGASAFNADGTATVGLKIKGREVELAGASAVVSSTGYAACGRIPVLNVGGGLGQRWGESVTTFDGCDLGPYRTARPGDLPASLDAIVRPGDDLRVRWPVAGRDRFSGRIAQRAPGRAEAVDVAAGTRQLSLRLQATPGRAPEGQVVDARGTVLVRTAAGDALTERYLVQHDTDAGSTVVLMKNPPTGRLFVLPDTDAPFARVRTATAVAPRKVRASVLRRRGRLVLRWSVRPALLPGQELELSERSTDRNRARGGDLLVRTRRSAGERTITPAPGGGRRVVVAGVRTDGRILRQTTVARFTAPTDRPPAVRALRLLRSGRTVRATWAGGTPKDGWVVRSVTTTGRVQTQPVDPPPPDAARPACRRRRARHRHAGR